MNVCFLLLFNEMCNLHSYFVPVFGQFQKVNDSEARQQLGDNGSCMKINAIFISHFGGCWLISIHESSNFETTYTEQPVFSACIETLIEPSPCSHSALLTCTCSNFVFSTDQISFFLFLFIWWQIWRLLLLRKTHNNIYCFRLKCDDPTRRGVR